MEEEATYFFKYCFCLRVLKRRMTPWIKVGAVGKNRVESEARKNKQNKLLKRKVPFLSEIDIAFLVALLLST